ncbi:translation initiation factor IF-2-like [Penaeus chinensis]|uniref:translation initiation factor IF-2-like n=1 Tax=Penaeus chinensis TaxID=139456 RepID=UPI001FB71234|nr:translation initiation factor IF-2-like [Penaeus chinensis]
MPTKVKEAKAAPPAKNETPKKAAKIAKKVEEEEAKVMEIKVEDIKVEKTKTVETPTPKKTPEKTGKKTPERVGPEEPKEEMEVEDVKEKVEGSKKSRRRKKRKRTVKAEDTETKENESLPKKTKTDLEVPSEKMQKKTGKKTPKEEEPEEPKEEKEGEDTKEKVEGGEKAKKKRKRKRKRKRSEKAEEAEAKENESPQKKKKTNANVPDEKLELEGELLDMHAKRKTDLCERTLVIKMKKFKQEYMKQRPDMCKDALFYGIKFGKLCFVVYKSKAEAEEKLTKLKKNPEVNHAWHWKQQQINATVNPYTLFVEHLPKGTTEEELQKMFPTTTAIHYDTNKLFVNLAFSTKEDAETVFRESENLKLKDVGITVLFGKYGYSWEREPRRGTEKQFKPSTD